MLSTELTRQAEAAAAAAVARTNEYRFSTEACTTLTVPEFLYFLSLFYSY
jgi:hypothetical protein